METLLFYTAGTCSLGVQVALEWLGEPYDLCRVERADRSSAEFLRMNPQGKVPVLKVSDRVVFELSAILQHLAARRPELGLLPSVGAPDYDACNQWLSYLGSGLHAAFYPYYSPQRFIGEESAHAAVKSAALEQIHKHLGIVTQELEGKRYLLGARTLLDPYLYAMSRWTRKLFDLPREFPAIAQHQEVMEQEPAVKFALAVERGELTRASDSALQQHMRFSDYSA